MSNELAEKIGHGLAEKIAESAIEISTISGLDGEKITAKIEYERSDKQQPVNEDAELIEAIADRAIDRFGEERMDKERLIKALWAAHKAAPIRLADLLRTCVMDFHHNVIAGAYRHYSAEADSMRGDWTMKQFAEQPK